MKTRRHVMMTMQWYSPMYHRGIARYSREAGWSLDAAGVHLNETPSLDRVDGVIANVFAATPAVKAILKSKLPITNLALAWFKPAPPTVLMDNRGVGEAVGHHCLARGFRHFAFGAHDANEWTVRPRKAGFVAALRKRGFDCELIATRNKGVEITPIGWFFDRLVRQLRGMPKPVGFMAHNDDFAVQLLRACLNGGLRVPDDVAIIGCDNDELVCEFASVPLSSADGRLEQQAYEAAALLDRLMDGQNPPAKPIIVPHGGVIERQSSSILAVSHPGLAKVIRTLWKRYPDPSLSVERLAQDAHMTRRGLDMACHTHIGRTISEELRRVRLDAAIRLLEDTDHSVGEIARLCGYSRIQHLRNTLMRERGQNPREYRRLCRPTTPPRHR